MYWKIFGIISFSLSIEYHSYSTLFTVTDFTVVWYPKLSCVLFLNSHDLRFTCHLSYIFFATEYHLQNRELI